MRIKDGFMLREVAEQWVVVPLGERVVEFNSIMSLSECGALLWKAMEQKDVSENDLVESILAEYDIDRDTASIDVSKFISDLQNKNLIK